MTVQVLDVRYIGPGAAEAGCERVPDLIDGKRWPPCAPGGGPERLVGAAAGPRSKGARVQESTGSRDALGYKRDGGEPAALAARDCHIRDRVVETEVVDLKPAHLGRAHPGPVHQFQPDPRQ